MKKIAFNITVMIVTFIIVACDYCTEPITQDALYNVSVDKNEEYSYANTRILESSPQLENNHYGFIIERNGEFVERKNSSWCGTPPIARDNFNGHWKEISENLLEITVDFWGGVDTFNIEIVSVNDSELKIKYVYDYE